MVYLFTAFGSADSYGYLGGQSFSPVATVCDNDLGVKNIQSYQAQEECVEATVTDCNNDPVVGVKVDFTVQGANTDLGFGFTNALGKVQFCYIVSNPGLDTIIADVSGAMDTVYNTVLPTSLSISPTMATWSQGTNNCVTATVVDGNNLAVPNAQVIFMSTNGSSNAVNQTLFTNASGQAVMCYTATNTGKDTVKVSAGSLMQTGMYTIQQGGGQCAHTNSFYVRPLNSNFINAGANLPNTYYWGLSGVCVSRRTLPVE